MSPVPSIPPAQPVSSYLNDGVRIAAILLVWGVIASFFRFGVADLGLPFESLWLGLGRLAAATGVLNAVLYISYRAIDYWNASS